MGDFNFNLFDLTGHNIDFLNFMISNDLFPLVSIPTRIIAQTATLIDNIFVQSRDLNVSCTDVIPYHGSDHLSLLAVIN